MFSSASGRISQGLKNEFELAMVNEPSVFELLSFDCMYEWRAKALIILCASEE